MVAEKVYVRTDEHGSMRVAASRISLDSVVIGFQQGEAPETIQRNFPTLTLEEVYGAITYYLAHREEVDAYLLRQEDLWDRLAAEHAHNPTPAMQRLHATIKRLEDIGALTGAEYAAALSQMKSDLAARVAAGEITAEQADSMLRLQEYTHLTRASGGYRAGATPRAAEHQP